MVPTTDQVVGTLPSCADAVTWPPFISHSARLPLVSRHRMSALPSALKSRWPTIDQLPGTLPIPAGMIAVPLLVSCHMATSPPASRHRILLSAPPVLPPKLCVRLALQAGSGLGGVSPLVGGRPGIEVQSEIRLASSPPPPVLDSGPLTSEPHSMKRFQTSLSTALTAALR